VEPTEPIPDQILHPRIGHIILCRQDQDLEHRDTIIGWPATPRANRIGQ
jgi:hypothetical protein